jgi:hypothetical protein
MQNILRQKGIIRNKIVIHLKSQLCWSVHLETEFTQEEKSYTHHHAKLSLGTNVAYRHVESFVYSLHKSLQRLTAAVVLCVSNS